MAEALTLTPMTEAEYAEFVERSQRGYAEEIAASGSMDADAAAEKAAKDFAELLPDGTASPGMHLWTARVDGSDEPVGIGWIEVRERPSGTSAFVFDVEVEEQHRGRGLGRALMEALHDAARELGATSIALNVFGQNTTAIRLYDSLGYAVTAQQMKRDL